ncbi:hypothetical protein B0H15DRAFT_806582 [Mycena belliarum]|uniref:Uncharacterized protein n=1 Tax=Mycena belliarum TaxID=1033014 RepID=A0AAD6TNQ7_9AGAR|nr:hypothetical protein B0H15DRAFT_806582 [Mycena belliae]
MTSLKTGFSASSIYSPEELKRLPHSKAQARYREKSRKTWRGPVILLGNGCASAPPFIPPHRENIRRSHEAMQAAALRRRNIDADYRERERKKRFIDQHGVDAFWEYYYPQHEAQGKSHLPGLNLNQLKVEAERRSAQESCESREAGSKKKKSKSRGDASEIGIHASSLILVMCSFNTPCEMPFSESPNFKGTDYHDKSRRLHYYLVWDFGTFASRLEAENVVSSTEILIFFTIRDARRKWARLCRKKHCGGEDLSDDDNPSGNSSVEGTESDIGDPIATPSAPQQVPTVTRHSRKINASGPPRSSSRMPVPPPTAPRTPAPMMGTPRRAATLVRSGSTPRATPLPLDRKAPESPKRDTPKKPTKRPSITMPLYQDDDVEMEVRPSRKRSTTPAIGVPTSQKRAKSAASSPTVSSPSSLSSSSLGLGASVSSDPRRLDGVEERIAVAGPSSVAGASVSSDPRRPNGGGERIAVAGPRSAAGALAESPQVFLNLSTRRLYKDVTLALQEMEGGERLQIFKYGEMEQYLSAPGTRTL